MVRVTCPTCQKVSNIDIPVSLIKDKGEDFAGLVTVSLKIPCGHLCMIFLDRNFKMRGGQCAEAEFGGEEEAAQEEQAEVIVEPISKKAFKVSDLVLKLATDIIKMDVIETAAFLMINAQDKIEAAEEALINGDIEHAGKLLSSMRDEATKSLNATVADLLLKKIQKLNMLKSNNPGFDWSQIRLQEVDNPKIRAIRDERVRNIIAELDYNVMNGQLPENLVMVKKAWLEGLPNRDQLEES